MDVRLLRSIPIFSGLEEEDLERIANLCVHKTCAPNQVILVEEESGQSLFIIKRGSVKVSHVSEEGREVILSILNAGDFFGEMAVLDGRGRSANVTALAETELLVLRRGDFLGLLEDYPQISIALLRELAGRIRASDSHISALSLKDAMGRVAMALIHVAEKTGRRRGQEVVIPKLPIQQDLANMAGTARETISRAMSQFEEMGYLQREGRRLVIKDMEQFKRAFS
jgi:CRP-like cAMP-binding protein